MPFHPAIDEPSNACPDSNLSAEKALAGTETCCSLPRVSVKRRSTNLTSFSLIIFRTSLADSAISKSPQSWDLLVGERGTVRQNSRFHAIRHGKGRPLCHKGATGIIF